MQLSDEGAKAIENAVFRILDIQQTDKVCPVIVVGEYEHFTDLEMRNMINVRLESTGLLSEDCIYVYAWIPDLAMFIRPGTSVKFYAQMTIVFLINKNAIAGFKKVSQLALLIASKIKDRYFAESNLVPIGNRSK